MAGITGVGAENAERIDRWRKELASLLGVPPDFPVTVGGPIFALFAPKDGTPIGSGNATGVWLHRWTATWARDAYLGFIMYEEVAHHALARAGVPHEGLGDFMHEVFATWFQCEHWITTRRAHKAGLTVISNPVLPGGPPQNVGKHLGGALAGITVNRQHLDRWLQRLGADDPRRQAVAEVERLLPRPMTATDVAAKVYGELMTHPQAGQAWR